MTRDNRATLYFDGSCALCSAEIAHYRAQDKASSIAFVDVSEPAAEMGANLTREQAMTRLHLRYSDGTIVSGAKAFVGLWSRLPGWRWAARLANTPGVTPALEFSYRLFLPMRPTISRIIARLIGVRSKHTTTLGP